MKRRLGVIDFFVIAAMCVVLFKSAYFALDVGRYQCYASAFWYGASVLEKQELQQCRFILANVNTPVPERPFYLLPQEYPLLSLVPFSLGLISFSLDYETALKVWMLSFAASMYLILLRYASRSVAVLFAIYLVVGSWATAASRFDIVPALLTLLALICADRKKWHWAFAVLAIAALMKLYPIILLPLFLIAQQMNSKTPWVSLKRFTPITVFGIICLITVTLSLGLNREGTLAPLSYFQERPFQLESFWSSLLWLIQPFSSPLEIDFRFGAYNLISPLAESLSTWNTVVTIAGFLSICWLQIRRKITLATACVLMLLFLLLTGKVFSPQYLMWVTPFIAYVGRNNPWWVIPWLLVCALTTWIYPYIYETVERVGKDDLFFIVLAFRNGILALFFLSLLLYYFFTKNSQHSKTT